MTIHENFVMQNGNVWFHGAHPRMFAKVVLASVCAVTGRKVYTLHLSYPRIIHGEVMTHRVFCRNARSSRAVPVQTLLDDIRNDPFVPWHKTRNQRGMQGADGWDAPVQLSHGEYSFEEAWLLGRDAACNMAESFSAAQYHKQIANRLVEPWMWMDLLVTATDWLNFLHLRDHKDAEPHMRDLAVLVKGAIEGAQLQVLQRDEWHLPYITDVDRDHVMYHYGIEGEALLRKISAARCARISYAPFDGDGSYERELERYESLVGGDAIHASPLEHQCSPDAYDDMVDMHGPLTGFIQFRKTIPNEAVYG